MIHSARAQFSVVNVVICFVLLDFEKWLRKDNMCENNDHYRRGLWGGRVDQNKNFSNMFGIF